ncbi:tripartite tricarboxylate transporter permease [Oceanimonas smirnovii]|uniref:Tripartite tricarboxylate transporter permease n=1 Tax=Oceanimonas smirnovii TaxID=264574 RepID=A0ABW7NYI6_9GAMM
MDFFTGAFQPEAILANFIGVGLGIIFGILPGLTSTMAIALIIPLTFGMSPDIAFSALLGVYVGSIYAGSITAILISTPGTPAAAATLLEGPKLASRGHAGKALSMTTVASFVGGIFSCVMLAILAPRLASFALSFGPPEYFALGFFGLSVVAGLSSGSVLKGLISGLVGMFVATIGIDPVSGTIRNTMDIPELISGFNITPALVGLFAISQVALKLEDQINDSGLTQKIKSTFDRISIKELLGNIPNMVRSSAIGTFVGIIPATGSGTASYIAYNECKRFSSKEQKSKFGTGHIDGLAATESANNAVTGGALIPLLTLGIPGDVVTAVLLGGILLQGLTPGPLLFVQSPDVVESIYWALLLANIFMLGIGLLAVKYIAKIVSVPSQILMPIIVVLCVLGSYSVNNSEFDVFVMLLFGVLGYFMEKLKFPLPPLLLGFILSPIVEENFRKSMVMSMNDVTIFLERPISLAILLVTFAVFMRIIWTATTKKSNK